MTGGTMSAGAAAKEIGYPLSQVKSDSEGQGSSTTTLRETSVDKLFSGEPKHVNVHETGSGNPPILTCADLEARRVANRREPVYSPTSEKRDSQKFVLASSAAPGGGSTSTRTRWALLSHRTGPQRYEWSERRYRLSAPYK